MFTSMPLLVGIEQGVRKNGGGDLQEVEKKEKEKETEMLTRRV